VNQSFLDGLRGFGVYDRRGRSPKQFPRHLNGGKKVHIQNNVLMEQQSRKIERSLAQSKFGRHAEQPYK